MIAPGSVRLEPVRREEKQTLLNLLELYAHDFSEFLELDISQDGRFDYPLSDEWWESDGAWAFLLRVAGQLAGFALVRAGSALSSRADVMDVAEFFVLRRWRGQGIGAAAAQALFRRFPGAWEVRVRDENRPALAFWSRTIGRLVGAPVVPVATEVRGAHWNVFRFGPL